MAAACFAILWYSSHHINGKNTEYMKVILLKDVAEIEFGSLDYDVISKLSDELQKLSDNLPAAQHPYLV